MAATDVVKMNSLHKKLEKKQPFNMNHPCKWEKTKSMVLSPRCAHNGSSKFLCDNFWVLRSRTQEPEWL